MKCSECTNDATHIYKVHAPIAPITPLENGNWTIDSKVYQERIRYAHTMNMFLCENHIAKSELRRVSGAIKERYIPFRKVKAELDKLPDLWEKYWNLLYYHDGFYYFAPQWGTIYYVVSPSEYTGELQNGR